MKLLILGASVRSMVSSACYAGYDVCGVDLFADWDVDPMGDRVSEGRFSINRVDRLESALDEVNGEELDGAIVSGGVEHRFELVREIERHTRLLGPSSDDLLGLQDTVGLMEAMGRHGFSVPATAWEVPANEPPDDWIVKSPSTTGGMGVRIALADDLGRRCNAGYFQSRIEGEHLSALFVSAAPADGKADSTVTRLVGGTRQLVGEAVFGASPFGYCGSVGPVHLSVRDRQEMEGIGNYLARTRGLVGVWGIDFVVNPAGCWPVDINPRLTASAELFESYLRASCLDVRGVVDLHVQACLGNLAAGAMLRRGESWCPGTFAMAEGKAILFNRRREPVEITPVLFSQLRSMYHDEFFTSHRIGVTLADIPRQGVIIPGGAPMTTIRVRSESESEVREILEFNAGRVDAFIACVS